MKMGKKNLVLKVIVSVLLILLAVSPGIAEEPLSLSGGDNGSSPSSQALYTLAVEAPEAGEYFLRADYQITSGSVRKMVFSLKVNGEYQQEDHQKLYLPALWKDDSQDYKQNEFGSDLYPTPVLILENQQMFLRDRVYYADAPIVFTLQKGVNEIEIEVTEAEAVFHALEAVPVTETASLETYLASIPASASSTEDIMLEGEKYTLKSGSAIRPGRSRESNLHPFDAARSIINFLEGGTWDEPGESVTYHFTVEETGVYYLALRYRQSAKSDMSVFKTIQIDGKTPCAPLSSYGFSYTGTDVKETMISAKGQSIPFYLEKGEHTLTLTSTAAPIASAHQMLKSVITEMNNLALDIKIISGNRADQERNWKLEYYLPDSRTRLEDILTKIDAVYSLMESDQIGTGESTLSTLAAARRQINLYLTEKEGMNDLVNQLSTFAQSSGSLAESLSMLTADFLLQPLSIDRIYFQAEDKLPNDSISGLNAAWQEIRKTALSFVLESDIAGNNREDQLNVWLLGSAQELEALRELIDTHYPPNTVHVALANEGKIQLAISAGNAPDVVLGGGINYPYQLGIRDAVIDLTQFEDFPQVKEWFYAESFVPVTENDTVYALPQTLDMWVTFYRKDIMDTLGLEVPDTWDEMIEILPTIYRYGMSVNTALSSGGALKSFTQMMPIIMQHGGSLYTEDGMSADFTSPEFIEGFSMLTDCYTKYGMSTSISNFYSSFRNGTAPIGVSALGTYTLLRRAASELDGQWGVALMPATVTDEGLKRQHPAVVSGCYILSSSKRVDEAWEFLKWWMGEDVQTTFSVRLQTTYGEEYLWLTANRHALADSTLFADEDLQIILEQMEYLEEVPSHPASMLVQRALSDAWNRVVFSGEAVRSALDTAQLEANRGIDRKLQQFGFINEQGEQIDTYWQEEEE